MRYRIHKEGHKICAVLGIALLLINIGLWVMVPQYFWLRVGLCLISIGTLLFGISFFRIPLFDVEERENVVLAPADGKIVAIEVVDEKEYFQDKRIQVSIFMSPANVHVNRNPISGTVKYTCYHPGDYLVAWHPKSSEKNERFTTVIEDEDQDFEILIRQIAGKVARKISNYLDEGQQVLQGNELGFIKFGSRVDIFFPMDAKINVELKERVSGGKTILAHLPG